MGRFAFAVARVCGFLLAALPLTASSATETITYTYDVLGRVVATSTAGTVNSGHVVGITYDAAGNRTNYTVTGASLSLSVSDASVTEGGNLVFTVTLSRVDSGTVTVNYATSNGTATSGSDYTAASGTLTFAPGQTSKTVTVATIDDSAEEPSETVNLTLSSASGAVIGAGVGVGTIIDNDQPVSISVANASATEGGNVTFTVSLSAVSAGTVTVAYATSNGTATAGSDYTAASGTLTFSPGETSKTVSVATIDDATAESTETFTLTLSSATGSAVIGTGSATGSILDNDATIQISISNATARELLDDLEFTVTRTGVMTGAISVDYVTSNGTAISGTHFTGKSGTLHMSSGQVSKKIDIKTKFTSAKEGDKFMYITISNPSSGVAITNSVATGTIKDLEL